MAVRGYQLSALPQAPRLDMNIRVADPSALTSGLMRGFQFGSDLKQKKELKQLDSLAGLYVEGGDEMLEGLDPALAAKVKQEGTRRQLSGLMDEFNTEKAKLGLRELQSAELANVLRGRHVPAGENIQSVFGLSDEQMELLPQAESRLSQEQAALNEAERKAQADALKVQLDQVKLARDTYSLMTEENKALVDQATQVAIGGGNMSDFSPVIREVAQIQAAEKTAEVARKQQLAEGGLQPIEGTNYFNDVRSGTLFVNVEGVGAVPVSQVDKGLLVEADAKMVNQGSGMGINVKPYTEEDGKTLTDDGRALLAEEISARLELAKANENKNYMRMLGMNEDGTPLKPDGGAGDTTPTQGTRPTDEIIMDVDLSGK